MKENKFANFINEYEAYLIESFNTLWGLVECEYDNLESYSVIGGLLSRQVTLSMEMSKSPSVLNGHSAPLFLRAMTDLHIALAWIMKDLHERSKLYILHGLGDEKLLLEHYKKEMEDSDDCSMNDELKSVVDIKSNWINSQRRDFLVEVNLGHWAQLDYRKMSQDAGCEGIYKFAYKPFSQSAHNMWPHVSRFNCKTCDNPLHKYLLVPELLDAPLDLDYLYRSCKYVHMAYMLFVDKFNIDADMLLPLEWWNAYFENSSDDS